MKYRKKPVVIDAWQLTKENHASGAPSDFRNDSIQLYEGSVGGEIKTLEGIMKVSENDWIIKGIAGEFYPCKPDIFEATYEPDIGVFIPV